MTARGPERPDPGPNCPSLVRTILNTLIFSIQEHSGMCAWKSLELGSMNWSLCFLCFVGQVGVFLLHKQQLIVSWKQVRIVNITLINSHVEKVVQTTPKRLRPLITKPHYKSVGFMPWPEVTVMWDL